MLWTFSCEMLNVSWYSWFSSCSCSSQGRILFLNLNFLSWRSSALNSGRLLTSSRDNHRHKNHQSSIKIIRQYTLQYLNIIIIIIIIKNKVITSFVLWQITKTNPIEKSSVAITWSWFIKVNHKQENLCLTQEMFVDKMCFSQSCFFGFPRLCYGPPLLWEWIHICRCE